MRKILIAMDESEYAMKAVKFVGETVACERVQVTLYNVALSPTPPELGDEWVKLFPHFADKVTDFKSFLKAKEDKTRAVMEKAKEVLKYCGIPERSISVKIEERKEGVARDLLKEVEKEGYDVIVVGRRGLSAAKAFLLGSVSEKIIKYAKNCTVWVVG